MITKGQDLHILIAPLCASVFVLTHEARHYITMYTKERTLNPVFLNLDESERSEIRLLLS